MLIIPHGREFIQGASIKVRPFFFVLLASWVVDRGERNRQVYEVNGYDPVVGFLELGMAGDALTELNAMPVLKKKTERYCELLLATQMMLGKWADAAVTAERLCALNNQECGYFIHAAFCLHEIGDTEGAMKRLSSGPRALIKEPLYHYNLACYHAVLGEVDPAELALSKAFELDSKLRVVAEKDDDLVGIKF